MKETAIVSTPLGSYPNLLRCGLIVDDTLREKQPQHLFFYFALALSPCWSAQPASQQSTEISLWPIACPFGPFTKAHAVCLIICCILLRKACVLIIVNSLYRKRNDRNSFVRSSYEGVAQSVVVNICVSTSISLFFPADAEFSTGRRRPATRARGPCISD